MQEEGATPPASWLGLGMEFRFKKIPRNILGTVIPRKKVLIPRLSEVHGRFNSEARNGIKQKKQVLQISQNNLTN